MINLKTLVRIGGIVIAAIGVVFFPSRNYVFDKGDQSTFHNLADSGVFASVGLALIVVGLLAVGLSFLVRGDLSE